jgi:Rrf2 family protein
MEGLMLSQRSHYALRAMLILATHGDRPPMRTAHIARAANVSAKFLEAILLELRKSGLLVSRRGRKGGFQLARPADRWRWRPASMKWHPSNAPIASQRSFARSGTRF